MSVLDLGPRRMVLGQWQHRATPSRTLSWNPFDDRVRRIGLGTGYISDVSADRVGMMLGDPYEGGCQKVVTLTRPRTTLWLSCTERAVALPPGGQRMVTAHIPSDGPGPRLVRVRAHGGRLLRTYRSVWFGTIHWEDDRRVVLQAAAKAGAMVRCMLRSCERISRLYRTGGRKPWAAMPVWQFADESLPRT